MIKLRFLPIVFLVFFISCKKNSNDVDKAIGRLKVINFDDKVTFKNFDKMNLDSLYPNLLNPQISKGDYQKVFQSWTQFHQKVSEFIKAENFHWGVKDSTIAVTNKIYFDEDGRVEYYFFKVMNTAVSSEKKREFEQIINKFSENIKLDLLRDSQFAQCGKIKYMNY